jgi:4-cresol dehydrogenase (hydroxylating)
VDAIRPVRLDGTIKSAMHVVNDYKAVSAFGQYPWKEVDNITPLPTDWLAEQCKTKNIGGWNASGALYGTKAEVANARKKLKQALKHIKSKKVHFIDEGTIKLARLVAKPYKWFTGVDLEKALDLIVPVINLKKGVPSNTFIPSTYWRKKTPVPAADEADPDKDKCGLLWLAPIAPMTGEHAVILEELIERILASYHFDPAISMTLLTERCIDSVIAISYDREVPGEEERALACHDTLLKELVDKGYYPYRLSTHAMGQLPGAGSEYNAVLAKIKRALDPNHIISPGRYE